MYSRSLDSRRIQATLPSHYGGSAFRADGTPMPIPVRREYEPHPRETDAREVAPPEETDEVASTRESEPQEETLTPSVSESGEHSAPEEGRKQKDIEETAFLPRLLDGMLPGVREDDLLLLLLILLLSREKGNEDALVLLAFLLLAK